MNENVNIIIFNLSAEALSSQQLKSRFSSEPNINFDTIRFYKEINNHIKVSGNAILLFKVENKSEFVQALAIIKSNQNLIESGLLKPACLLGVNSKKVERLLFKYGCRDVLDINVNPRTLIIKTEMWVRSICNILNQKSENFLTLAQRSQDLTSTGENSEYNMRSLPEVDSWDDEKYLEDDLGELIDELETENDEFELDSLMDEIEEDNIFDNEEPEDRSRDLHIVTTEESSPELVEFISENGDTSFVNLESGYLGLVLEGQDKADCVFENFEEDHMVLEVPNDYSANENEKLRVWVKFVYNKCRVELELSGAITEIEVLEDGKKHVKVTFNQAEVERYDYFMSLYEKRQKSINDFMELARGY